MDKSAPEDQAAEGDAVGIAEPIASQGPDLPQEPGVIFAKERMIGALGRQELAVLAHALGMEVGLGITVQDLGVVVRLRIGQHPPRDLAIGDSIAFVRAGRSWSPTSH